jgi:hypothetical protein
MIFDTAGAYSVPRACGLTGCDFQTWSRTAFWAHVMEGHDPEEDVIGADDFDGPDPDMQRDLRDGR